jgi:hypothetical protein
VPWTEEEAAAEGGGRVGQGSGRWYGVPLTRRSSGNGNNSGGSSGNGNSGGNSGSGAFSIDASIDVDDSWCPNPPAPPLWEETLALFCTSGRPNAADPGLSETRPAEQAEQEEHRTSVYVWHALSRAQQALAYCLEASRTYEAECAACTGSDGAHSAVSALLGWGSRLYLCCTCVVPVLYLCCTCDVPVYYLCFCLCSTWVYPFSRFV